MNIKDINVLKTYFNTPKKIVFVAHKNPDGDAVGSTTALAKFYKKLGHEVQVVLPNGIPDFISWIPGSDEVYRYDLQNIQSKRALDQADVVFLLDFNALHRVGDDMQNGLEAFKGDFIMIDHHQQPDDIAMVTYSDTSICSTCQMVYHFIDALELTDLIDADIATSIYTGIMTDTGSFRFPSTTSTTHRIIADLIDKGAENANIHNQVYSNNSYSRLQLLGKSLTNLKVIEDCKTAYITLTQQELKMYNYQKGDTEGVVNYALSLKGVVLAAIFIEDTDQGIVKISFRSKGKFSVNQFARNYFDGGGHDNAAGARSITSLEETIDKFLSIVPKYKQELFVSYEA
ncbi:phosphoesterase RecJ-like protein [Wenyingzhuangia heitensis]|uniref:Phosphoesterase RecJ-like protein n=1 Tax=Wenyingzhuangia heitensis TaxID=1487859 RepID=A0ABX0UEJ8_9FLAO|nr:bifunctional oligoribonuclease/PAP phosphatase NrnA [Wenyingzhuangia heitensis]NIJ45467.1 phosphoesterase RecJ-like protein [Wenyingzhuangia heitensis]